MSRDPLRYFRVEARELVDQISAGVLDLDQRPGPEPVARLLRYAHTLKGAARVVRQQGIAERAHAFEEVLVPHREATDALPAEQIRELLRLNDEIEARVTALGTGTDAPPAAPTSPGSDHNGPARPAREPLPRTAAAAGLTPAAVGPDTAAADESTAGQVTAGSTTAGRATASPAPATLAARTPNADIDDLLDAVGDAHARFAPLRSGTRALGRLQRAAESLATQLRTGTRPDEAHRPLAERAAAGRLATELSSLQRRLADAVEQVDRDLDEVRGRAERLRLVAASGIFTGLHRAVRDAADAQGRRVTFEGRGGDLRIDPQVLTQASSALLHVVRNAVVHGIEDAAERTAAGKPAEGSIVVEVERRGRYAAFRCTDDGRGFDLPALRSAAESRGLLASGELAGDPQRLVDLALRGGISTSGTVDEVAGRGIGLDVARDVAEQLGGDVAVRTTAGAGSTIELVVPLSLLSLHGLVVRAGGMIATLPLDAVRTCVRLPAPQAAAATACGRLAHDGAALPYLPLAHCLGRSEPTEQAVAVLVVADGTLVAVGVDRLEGTSTLVVRPLPDLAPAAPIVGGVSMDLDGNPRLVLDAHGLLAEALRFGGSSDSAASATATRLPILVVDDSLTTRMLERSILESAGYQVDVAASGEEALDKARSQPYCLYLTDIDMPGIDGFTFVERIRADPALRRIPTILVSSRSSGEDRQRGVQVGADAYVVKGEFDQEELLAHIRKLVPA